MANFFCLRAVYDLSLFPVGSGSVPIHTTFKASFG